MTITMRMMSIEAYSVSEHYTSQMKESDWYEPVPRGLETKIAEKMAYLRQLDRNTKKRP